MRHVIMVLGILMCLTLTGVALAEEDDAIGRTPPRLSFVDGQVSFWRPGAQGWVQAQVNTALAPGDQLFAGPDGNFELQIGSRAFVRGGADTQIGLETQEPDFLQFKVTTGHAAFDLRTVEPGRTVEVDTPNAAFTMNTEGYYRVGVSDQQTSFTTRRAGRANAIPAGGGAALPIGPNETVNLDGTTNPMVNTQAAVPLDDWDRWNYDRTGQILEAASNRYVAPGTYGVNDLDRHGTWQTDPTYGPVWRPSAVVTGWAPYTTGSWMNDPYYGWTWVDTAPWGWAPYHYGRWVQVNRHWCWAPGPRVIRPVYAPALVAFFGVPGLQVSVSVGSPIGWVSLGWGEPIVPWWGRPGFIHHPWWGGWGGPRFVNNRRIHHTTVVHVHEINHYHNARIRNAVVVVDRDRFGRGQIRPEHLRRGDADRLRPMHQGPAVTARPESFVPNTQPGRRPSEVHLNRSVVSTRPQRSDPQRTSDRLTTTEPTNNRQRNADQRPQAAPETNRQRPSQRTDVTRTTEPSRNGPSRINTPQAPTTRQVAPQRQPEQNPANAPAVVPNTNRQLPSQNPNVTRSTAPTMGNRPSTTSPQAPQAVQTPSREAVREVKRAAPAPQIERNPSPERMQRAPQANVPARIERPAAVSAGTPIERPARPQQVEQPRPTEQPRGSSSKEEKERQPAGVPERTQRGAR